MPELTPQSSAATPSLPPSLFAAPPAEPPEPPVPFSNDPRVQPPAYDWEDHPAFRFTFLMHYTKNADRLALEHIGAMLYDFALEAGGGWPAWNETTTRAELRAVAAGNRHAQAFLLAVAKERETVSLGVEDERLSFQATYYANQCSSIAFGLESIVGPPWRPAVKVATFTVHGDAQQSVRWNRAAEGEGYL